MQHSLSDLRQRLADQHYVADQGLAISLFLALRLGRPLFLEGEAGVGKTSLAAAAAAALDADLIRLQCYEGLDISHAVYEWDYARQLLELRILDAAGALNREDAHRELYSDAFLIKRPLLQAIDPARSRPAVLLIDEIDRADEEFEGYLLELLAEFQVTIPELGTVRAKEPPLVILTSNRTREVHDALKRRCLYQWIEYPSFEKELAIVRARVPGASARLAEQITTLVQSLRRQELYKVPGVSETIDWVTALVALDRQALDPDAVNQTLGIVLKTKEDLESVRGEKLASLVSSGGGAGVKHIALLRAVNLGAHNKIGMADLKALLVGLGFEDAQTLLQSGNVVFSGGSKTTAALEQTLERAAAKQLGLETDFFVRTAKEWQAVIDANPFPREAKDDPEPSARRDHEGSGGARRT